LKLKTGARKTPGATKTELIVTAPAADEVKGVSPPPIVPFTKGASGVAGDEITNATALP